MRRLQEDAELALRRKRRPTRSKPIDRRAASKRPSPPRAAEDGGNQLRLVIERQLAQRLDKILERLDLPSRRDIEDLSERVAKIEEALVGQSAPPRRKL